MEFYFLNVKNKYTITATEPNTTVGTRMRSMNEPSGKRPHVIRML